MTHTLGRRLDATHDPRSLDYPAPPATVTTRLWGRGGGVLDQGRTSACTGFAMAQALNTRPLHVYRSCYLTGAQAIELYSAATRLDPFPGEYPPDDTGSDGLAVAKAALAAGRITRYEHAFGLDHALQALMHGPVLVGTLWTDGMFQPDSAGFVRPTGSTVGGHEWLAIGVSVGGRYVTAVNSWGRSWGRSGRFRVSWDDLDWLLKQHGDVTLPVREP